MAKRVHTGLSSATSRPSPDQQAVDSAIGSAARTAAAGIRRNPIQAAKDAMWAWWTGEDENTIKPGSPEFEDYRRARIYDQLPDGAVYRSEKDGSFRVKSGKGRDSDREATRDEAMAQSRANQREASKALQSMTGQYRKQQLEALRDVPLHIRPMLTAMAQETATKDTSLAERNFLARIPILLAQGYHEMAEPMAEMVAGDSAGTDSEKDILRQLRDIQLAANPTISQDESWLTKYPAMAVKMLPYMPVSYTHLRAHET